MFNIEPRNVCVSRPNIEMGVPSECQECAVSRALREAYPGYRASVDEEEIIIYKNIMRDGAYMKTPARVQAFLKKFDAGKSVKPFAFTFIPHLEGQAYA